METSNYVMTKQNLRLIGRKHGMTIGNIVNNAEQLQQTNNKDVYNKHTHMFNTKLHTAKLGSPKNPVLFHTAT